ncbi:MAG: family 16 glycoside hydrolase, partial [Gemmataceae bacterium]
KDDVESKLGDWTKVECVCDGAKLTVLVNGVKVTHAYDVTPAAGKILLQVEGFELFVRKFEVRPLK